METTATIDGKVKVVTEASVRRHLKLEDSNGISILPTTKVLNNLHLWEGSLDCNGFRHSCFWDLDYEPCLTFELDL
nr:hypothetical protein [Tanacetum cinerariifolium]